MSGKELMLTLGKVIIAAAWADGDLTHEEINSLKELLLRLAQTGRSRGAQLTQRDWAVLEIYLHAPVDDTEREQLVAQLQSALQTSEEREFAIAGLEAVIQADGIVTETEKVVTDEIRAALEAVHLGLFGQLGRLVRGSVSSTVVEREKFLDDFIRNKVYYAMQRRLEAGEAKIDLPEAELWKLGLAGSLMAVVAHVDHQVSAAEYNHMVDAIQTGWDLSPEAAAFVAEVAVSQIDVNRDSFRLSRELADQTTEDEQARFVETLFAVARADGRISHEENESIRTIANNLLLPHRRFIEAKKKLRQAK